MRLHPVVRGAVAALVVLTVPGRPLPAQLALGAAPPAIRTEADLTRFLDDLELQQWVLNRAGALKTYVQSRLAEWLTRQFYGPGQSVAWPEKVRRATGRPLDARALAEYLAVEVGG